MNARLETLYTFIGSYIDRNACAPTLREMQAGTGFHHTTVRRYLEMLAAQQAITYLPKRSRAISINKNAPSKRGAESISHSELSRSRCRRRD